MLGYSLPCLFLCLLHLVKALVLLPIRDGVGIVYNLNHPKLFKGGQCEAHSIKRPAEDCRKHFIGIGKFIIEHKHTAVVLLASHTEQFKPHHNDAVRLGHTLY